MRLRVITDLRDIDADAWDALAGDDDPFVDHAFLQALEESGSVGAETGWMPCHLTVWDDAGELVGALPFYEKSHSYGEYIFDWAWADAAMRIGLPYYPKLVSMTPLTPATGRRVLFRRGPDSGGIVAALVSGALEMARSIEASSIHFNFLEKEERDALIVHPELMPRLTQQFHWHNDGYGCFDDFLAALRSPNRKQIRKERRRVKEANLEVRVKRGPDLDERDWRALAHFYRDTCRRKGSFPYLTTRFFELLPERLGHRVVAALAYEGSRPVAGTLNFEKGAHLYGRYWGSESDYDMLHFELCYYQLIERAIDRGLTRFEAGAQGMHKLKRGLMPSPIHSVHWVRHPVLAGAVAEFLPREAHGTAMQIEELGERGPFKRTEQKSPPD
ncbi:MAG: N-acetyltransferase [Deltaproteobacteria bacterium]|nr:N-acetyltransferase [Deltaproteobacteria bacterium]